MVGAVVGGVLGGTVENIAGRQKGYELDVKKKNGTVVRLLQRKQSLKGIRVGEEVVRLLESHQPEQIGGVVMDELMRIREKGEKLLAPEK